ncbi:MAG TPA: phosphate propanoyltransferase [Firmicutes bacterium]|nr:phosphate propanoyltransferase [Bacillota bacterium]
MESSILIEVSARHVHVSREALDVLFGKDYELTVRKELSQPGQFASGERVTIVGPKRSMENVSILGPVRSATQVEISATDARSLGIPCVVRESGDIDGTPGCKIIGPAGEIEIDKGVIVAKRHIHMTPADAERFNVKDRQIVNVKVNSNSRSLVFGDVVIRVSDKFSLAMHVDTDEGNAAMIGSDTYGEIIYF